MKVQPIDPKRSPAKILVREFKQKKANAYARGQFGCDRGGGFMFEFEEEAYQAGIRDSLTVKQWVGETA